jgi:hypothetical protein
MSSGVGSNAFYGNNAKSGIHPQSRQPNNLGSKNGTSSSQQQSMISKNEIIAKYMKSQAQLPANKQVR